MDRSSGAPSPMSASLRPSRIVVGASALAFGLLVCSAFVPAGAGAAPAHRISWHQIMTSTSPAPRDRAGIAYDPADNYTVLYGGYNAYGAPFYYDTWAYSAGVWHSLNPAHHPTSPTGLVMAYDPALSGVLEFGGEAPYGSAFYNDTWLFHGGNWTLLSPTVSPPARSQYMMAYDAADSEMVLFGGIDGATNELSDTWVFNGTTWAQVVSSHHPQGRQFGSMVYDAAANGVLLLGGRNASLGAVAGTWLFSAGHWSKVPNAGTPLRSFMLASPMANGTPLIFGGLATGGSNVYNTSFEFFSGAWHKVHFANAPPQRGITSMTYDAHDGYVFLFGGWNATNGYMVLGDSWALY